MPGIHERFMEFIEPILGGNKKIQILDVGAGHGAVSQKLWLEGYRVEACDRFPEYFCFREIECRLADITEALPYEDESFDMLLAVEVMEHIQGHGTLFSEADRILKPGGRLVFSTPNILSLKSRIRFLFSGFFYSFGPLDYDRDDGLQHLSSLTLDQYLFLGRRHHFKLEKFGCDKRQRSSSWWSFLIPFIWIFCKIRRVDYSLHNRFDLLTGRVLFISFIKESSTN